MLQIYKQLARPLLERGAAAFTGALMAWGVQQDTATALTTTLVSAVLIAFDIAMQVASARRR